MINIISHHRFPLNPRPVLNFSYSTSDLIGKGFTSQVYRGTSNITGFPLAIKVIDKNLLKEQDRRLIRSQIASMRKLRGKSPYVLNLVEVNEVGQTVFIVTEQCDYDLARLLQERRLTEKEAIGLMEEVLRGYFSIAQQGIVHRDLKPANLFLKNGHVKIGDFGFAIDIQQCASCHNVGSPLYMSPQAMHSTQYSSKSDIWALGITFYEMLFGSVPWNAENEQQLLDKIMKIPITQILKEKNINQNCALFLEKSLNVNPRLRMSLQQLQHFSLKPIKSLASLRTQTSLTDSVAHTKSLRPSNPIQKQTSFNVIPSQKNICVPTPLLQTPIVTDTDRSQTGKVINSQLMLCEYLLLLFTQLQTISPQKRDTKRCFSKFISRILSQIKLTHSQNPFNLSQLQSFRQSSQFRNLQSKTTHLIEQYKRTFKVQQLKPIITQSNYRQMKQQIMNNITGLFLDSNKPPQSNTQNSKKYILDNLVACYDAIRIASVEDYLLFSKTSNIQQLLQKIKSNRK